MAKLHGAEKEAFKRKMAAGRRAAASRRGHGGGAKRKKKGRKNPLVARHDISRGETLHRSMFDRTKNPIAYVVNPGAPKMAKKSHKKSSHKGHKKGKGHRRRRRNPGIPQKWKDTGKKVALFAIPAVLAGAAGNLLEAKALGGRSLLIRGGVRAVLAGVTSLLVGRKHPMAAGVAMGALLGPIGGELGTKLGGGLVLTSAKKGMGEIVQMAADSEEIMEALVEEGKIQGIGVVLDESGMSDDDDMGDDGEGEMGDEGADMDGDDEDEAA